jgi:hypothetical protein
VFNRGHIKKLAIATGFTLRRSGKLDSVSFFNLLLYAVTQPHSISLSHTVSFLSDNGIKISKQSLDGRFNDRCLEFVKAVFKEIIQDRLPSIYGDKFFEAFSSVPVKDSTKIKTPDSMSDNYPGIGGNPSGISIQYEYDLKTGKVTDLNITAANRNDRSDSVATVAKIESGSLIIRDSGYYAGVTFQSVEDNGTFFLSRLHGNTAVYHPDDTVVNFTEIYSEMQRQQIYTMELPVYFKVNGKKIARMNLNPVPEEVYTKRIGERDRENREKRTSNIGQIKSPVPVYGIHHQCFGNRPSCRCRISGIQTRMAV